MSCRIFLNGREGGVRLTMRHGAMLPSVVPLLSLDYRGFVVVLKGLNVINNLPFHIIERPHFILTLYSKCGDSGEG